MLPASPASPFWSAPILFPHEPERTLNVVRWLPLQQGTEAEAKQWLQKGKRLGQYRGALINGKHAEACFKNAASLFWAAVCNGQAWGMIGIATLYFDGYHFSPIKKNWRSAEYWLLQAAWLDKDSEALALLADFYSQCPDEAVLNYPELTHKCYETSYRRYSTRAAITDLRVFISDKIAERTSEMLGQPRH